MGEDVIKMKTHLSSLKMYTLVMAMLAVVITNIVATPVSAVTCATGQSDKGGVCSCPSGQQAVSVPVDSSGSGCVPINDRTTQLTQNQFSFIYATSLIFVGGGVGLAVVGGLVFGSYMYITARGNAAQAQKGQTTILNSVIGLLLFIFMYAILQFLIPGGILG